MQKSQYQKSCIVICGDVLEDWKYVFRELKMTVGVSVVSYLLLTLSSFDKHKCLACGSSLKVDIHNSISTWQQEGTFISSAINTIKSSRATLSYRCVYKRSYYCYYCCYTLYSSSLDFSEENSFTLQSSDCPKNRQLRHGMITLLATLSQNKHMN